MLEVKLKYIDQSKDGRSIVVKDATGLMDDGVPTGYSDNDLDSILSYYYTVSRIKSKETFVFHHDGTDPYLPSVVDIAKGKELRLMDNLFNDNPDSTGQATIFLDGVLDLNMYVEFEGMSGVYIEKGTNYIVGGDFTQALKYDAIVVDEVIYQIDKSMDDNGASVLYIIGEFESDADEFNVLYRSNVKCFLTSMSADMHDYACKQLVKRPESIEWHTVNTAASMRLAAYGLFKQDPPDYYSCQLLINSSFKLLKRYTA